MVAAPSPAVLTLADGRDVEYVTFGGGETGTLVYHHGTPSAWDVPSGLADAAVAGGLRVVSAARPGYAGSSGHAGRRVASVAADTAALLDHLGIGSVAVLGWSGGGPHALACAALLPGRVRAVGIMAGVAPQDAEGLDWLSGMGEANLEEFAAAVAGEDDLGRYLLPERDQLLRAPAEPDDAEDGGDPLDTLLSDADREAMAAGLADELATSMARALRSGIEGWMDDDLAFVRPWGFDPATITVPTTIWQGTEDLMVPPGHGEWLADHLPTARLEQLPGEGHLSLINRAADIVARLG